LTYIGQQPSTTFDSGIQDRFTGLSSNTVTLTHDISAETDILVVWNNIVQDSGTYSVGGTGNKTLTLGGTLVSADVVTVYYTNKVMQSVNPTAGSVNTTQLADLGVTGAKLNTDVISAQTALGATPADTDEMLLSDSGVLKRIDYSHIKGGTTKPYFSAMRAEGSGSQSIANNTWTKVTFPTTIIDSASAWASNEQYTIPTGAGGLYFVSACVYWAGGANNIAAALKIYINGDSNPLPNNGTTNTNATLSYYANGEDSSNNFMSTGSGTFRFNDADEIEIYAWHDKGSAMNVEPSGTRVTAFRIGDV